MASDEDLQVTEAEEKKVKTFKAVRVVQSRGKGAVVEWVEDAKSFRKIVPLKFINNDKVEESVLNKSPDYGVPWGKSINPSATSEGIETALHNAGIWTSEDALTNPGAVIGALNAAYKTDLVAVLQAAKKYNNKE